MNFPFSAIMCTIIVICKIVQKIQALSWVLSRSLIYPALPHKNSGTYRWIAETKMMIASRGRYPIRRLISKSFSGIWRCSATIRHLVSMVHPRQPTTNSRADILLSYPHHRRENLSRQRQRLLEICNHAPLYFSTDTGFTKSEYIHPLSQIVLEHMQSQHSRWVEQSGLNTGLTVNKDGTFLLRFPRSNNDDGSSGENILVESIFNRHSLFFFFQVFFCL